MAACSTATFEFDSAKGGKGGQQGAIPQLGFGSATLFDDPCRDSIRAAVKAGYRHIDTALLYGNQKEVGEAVAAVIDEGLVTREELWVTTKVGFYPGMATESTIWKPLAYHDCNRKGEANTAEAVDTCLELLGLDYADLILIHNPCTAMDEYHASGCLHWFELSDDGLATGEGGEPVVPRKLPDGADLRSELSELRRGRAAAQYDAAQGKAERAATWKALEAARAAGKCKYIGVSNYPAALLREMQEYAEVMPAVNQLELHPRYASPKLQAAAKELGVVLTGYGTGNSVAIEKSPVIKDIAARVEKSPVQVVLKWTIQSGVVAIPRSGNAEHIAENADCIEWSLSDEDMAAISALDEAHPYYWDPLPCLAPGTSSEEL